MTVRCFTRKERDGMYVIQPLEGRSKLDCMIVNETVKFVYDRIAAGTSFADLTAAFTERARYELGEERRPAAGAADSAANGSGTPRTAAPSDYESDEERI